MLSIDRETKARGFCHACRMTCSIEHAVCPACGGVVERSTSTPEPVAPKKVTLKREEQWHEPFSSVD
jgi:hypothetical protein